MKLSFQSPISAVHFPDLRTAEIASSIAHPSLVNPNDCPSIMATERIIAIGFALFFPAISGADP